MQNKLFVSYKYTAKDQFGDVYKDTADMYTTSYYNNPIYAYQIGEIRQKAEKKCMEEFGYTQVVITILFWSPVL